MKTATDCSLLWEAARLGDLKTVKKFVSINPTWIQACDHKNNNWTALCYACNHRHLPVIRYLLEIGSDKNHVDNFGETPVSRATKRGFIDVERLLLSFKPVTDEKEKTNKPTNLPLPATNDTDDDDDDDDDMMLFDEVDSWQHVASDSSWQDISLSETSQHSENDSDDTTRSPRDTDSGQGKETNQSDQETESCGKMSTTTTATTSTTTSNKEQPVDVSTSITAAASLRAFCAEGNVEALHRLLNNIGHANKSIINQNDSSSSNNNNNNSNLLEHSNAFGSTLLHIACWYGHANIVRELLQRGARPDATNKANMTPLHLACWKGHETVVLALLRPRFRWISHQQQQQQQQQRPVVTIHAADKQGWTPLHRAAVKGHVSIIRHLLQAGANPLRCTKNGQRPYDCVPATYELVRLVLQQAEQEFRYKQVMHNSSSRSAATSTPTKASPNKQKQEKQQHGAAVIARAVHNPATRATQNNNASLRHVPLARVVAIEPLVYPTIVATTTLNSTPAVATAVEHAKRIPVDPPEEAYDNLVDDTATARRPSSSSDDTGSSCMAQPPGQTVCHHHDHQHREAILIKWKELKLTEIQQAIDLAKLLCPNPDPSNTFWKQVLARQKESQTIDEGLQKLLLTDMKK